MLQTLYRLAPSVHPASAYAPSQPPFSLSLSFAVHFLLVLFACLARFSLVVPFCVFECMSICLFTLFLSFFYPPPLLNYFFPFLYFLFLPFLFFFEDENEKCLVVEIKLKE